MRLKRSIGIVLVLLACLGTTGCVSFSGPNDIRNAIASSADVELKSEGGVTVGPLAVFAVQVFAGSMLPFKLDGLSSVSFGEYSIRPGSDGEIDFSVRDLELDGWEPIVRIREEGSDMAVMVDTSGNSLRRMLFIQREGTEVTIVRAKGRLEKLLDQMLEGEWGKGWSMSGMGRDGGGGEDQDKDQDEDKDQDKDEVQTMTHERAASVPISRRSPSTPSTV